MITAAATLHAGGEPSIQTTAQAAAQALRPIAGPLAEAIFALGVASAPGLLFVPVLRGSAAKPSARLGSG